MSAQSKVWLWRFILVVVQLLVIPLVVYTATVSKDRDRREMQQYVAERYLSLEDWRSFMVEHESRTLERFAALRTEIKAGDALLLQEIRSVGAQIDQLARLWDRRPPPLDR